MTIKHIFQNDKAVLALVGTNGFFEAVHRFVIQHQQEASALLTWLQIAIAIWTIVHFAKKTFWKKKK